MSHSAPLSTAPASGPDSLLLVEEITHRVLNEYTEALSTLALATASMACSDGREILAQVARRLRSQAEAHQVLQAPLYRGPVDLGDHLERLCRAMSKARWSGQLLKLSLPKAPAVLDAPRCWRVGLIVSELVTNAMRHGGGGEAIVVGVETLDGEIRCWVSNPGPCSPNRRHGHGQRVVEGLARELGGSVQRRFGADGGHVLLALPASPVVAMASPV